MKQKAEAKYKQTDKQMNSCTANLPLCSLVFKGAKADKQLLTFGSN